MSCEPRRALTRVVVVVVVVVVVGAGAVACVQSSGFTVPAIPDNSAIVDGAQKPLRVLASRDGDDEYAPGLDAQMFMSVALDSGRELNVSVGVGDYTEGVDQEVLMLGAPQVLGAFTDGAADGSEAMFAASGLVRVERGTGQAGTALGIDAQDLTLVTVCGGVETHVDRMRALAAVTDDGSTIPLRVGRSGFSDLTFDMPASLAGAGLPSQRAVGQSRAASAATTDLNVQLLGSDACSNDGVIELTVFAREGTSGDAVALNITNSDAFVLVTIARPGQPQLVFGSLQGTVALPAPVTLDAGAVEDAILDNVRVDPIDPNTGAVITGADPITVSGRIHAIVGFPP